jgi:hypothetical protein
MNLGVRKMKKINLIKFVPIVLMGFALSVQAQGYIASKRVSWTPSAPVAVTHDYPVIRVVGKITVDPFVSETVIEDSSTLECWMFQEEYLDIVYPSVIEGWMLAEQYLSTENVPVENWMKDPGYLSN